MKKSPIANLREGLDSGDLSSEYLALRSIEKIKRLDGRINAINAEMGEFALNAARLADRRLRSNVDGRLRLNGDRQPFLGIPVVVKDNMACKGQLFQNGSKITKGFISPFSATVVNRLLSAGAVPVARAAMDEFALGSSGEYHAFGPTRNPWDTSKVAGGSSSGSAAAVAAGYAPFALGSDTGGSVRLPGAFCGVSALRPTYGVLSRYGVTAMASSLDQVGPMAKHVEDIAMGFSVMAGVDPHDSTSVDLPGIQDLLPLIPKDLKNLKIGYFAGDSVKAIQPAVQSCVSKALETLEGGGAKIINIDLPCASYALETYCLLNTAEVSSNLSRFDGVRYGNRVSSSNLADMVAGSRNMHLGLEAKRRILLGTFCLSKGHYDAYYLKALKARNAIARSVMEIFNSIDFIVTPVSPITAFALGEKVADPLEMYMMDILTVLPALADIPALAVPAGLADGLPAGVQFIGPRLSDCDLLRLGYAFQQLTDHHLLENT
ncbi:MAG: aspartyl/glutamyl-tRNA amidotransferase subunit A [Holophagales bacterium]|jgi:aspartyl-tRNA(Asn)/glutamyl-tRNA(Gln) amidotransferase subunit A|nr:aspartyl/glutamyl-tRNA amidotransferase subunit A [Holophagales bacterium]